MKSFEEFKDRVDDLLTQVAGPAAGMEMLVRAKGDGVFNDHYDDASRGKFGIRVKRGHKGPAGQKT